MTVMHFLALLMVVLTALGMDSENGGSGTNTPTGPATVVGDGLGNGEITPPELAEAIEQELDEIARYNDQVEMLNKYFPQ